jgi:hypothetical protein
MRYTFLLRMHHYLCTLEPSPSCFGLEWTSNGDANVSISARQFTSRRQTKEGVVHEQHE